MSWPDLDIPLLRSIDTPKENQSKIYRYSMAETPAARTFDFYGLPKELRDTVLDLLNLRVPQKSHKKEYADTTVWEWKPIKNLFLVSRQIRQQYTESCKRARWLTIVFFHSDKWYHHDNWRPTPEQCRATMVTIGSCRAGRDATPGEAAAGFAKNCDKLLRIASRLQRAKFIVGTITVGSMGVASAARPDICQKFVETAFAGKVSGLEVVYRPDSRPEQRTVVASWSAGRSGGARFYGPLAKDDMSGI